MSAEIGDLHNRIANTRVVVVGGGVAGLVAAWECAKLGLSVTVLEQSERLGGTVRSVELDGVIIDTGAHSYSVRRDTVDPVLDQLGLADHVIAPRTQRSWLARPTGPVPLPEDTVLGIPANPWSADVRAIIGRRGAWRAYLDRLRPPLTIGREHSLGSLVRRRMGPAVRDLLVAPPGLAVYGVDPDDVDVVVAAPGLNPALTTAGSLSGAVAAIRMRSAAEPTVASLDGGMGSLIDALVQRITELGGSLVTGQPVAGIERAGDGWLVNAAAPDAPTDAPSSDDPAATEPEQWSADAVIVATDESTARQLLGAHVPGLEDVEPDAFPVETISLLLEPGATSAAPDGAAVVTAADTYQATSVLLLNSQWGNTAKAELVRVCFGTRAAAPATATLADAEAAELARTQAAEILGIDLAASAVRASHRERFIQPPPASLRGRTELTGQARDTVNRVAGLAVTGAWLAGPGIAQIIPDAIAAADRIRRAALEDSVAD